MGHSDVQAEFERWLDRQPLAARTKSEYRRNVKVFLGWLDEAPDYGADPLCDRLARDHAVRDFRRWLKVERRAAASTVNLALASLDALYRQRELGNPNVRREKPVRAAPRALDVDEQRRLLRAAERSSARDRALVVLMLFTGVRISEAVALDMDDVQITSRKGRAVVRSGKGDRLREVPLNPLVRQMLDEWFVQRAELNPGDQAAVFLARAGTRLSARAADSAVRRLAGVAGLELSAHVLRHTCLTGLVRNGVDLVTVAELAGHSRIETTRRYSLPSESDRQQAVDDLQIDF